MGILDAISAVLGGGKKTPEQEQGAGQVPAGTGQSAQSQTPGAQPGSDSWVNDQPKVDPSLNEQAGSDPSSANPQGESGGLGDILGGGGLSGGGSGGLGGGINLGTLTALVPVILSMINQQGGIGALAEKFQRGGLGEIFNSWVNKGENREISPQQVDTALGPDTVDSIAQQTGHSRDDVLGSLSGILPRLVDTSTPDGQVPADGQARGENEVLNSLSSLFK